MNNIGGLAIQVIWIVISLMGITKIFRKRHALKRGTKT
jgi:hypothetical protein